MISSEVLIGVQVITSLQISASTISSPEPSLPLSSGMGNKRLTRVTGSGLTVLAVVAHQFWPFQTSLVEPALQLFSGVILSVDKRIAAFGNAIADYTQWFTHAQ